MRRPPYHREPRERLDVKMTPMIDVIFLLLIFFVCTAGFQLPEEILPTSFSLPGSVASELAPELEDLDRIVVKILLEDGKPHWQINERDYTHLRDIRVVLAAAAQIKNDLPVILDVADSVPLEDMIDVYDLCRQIGLKKIQFAASTDG